MIKLHKINNEVVKPIPLEPIDKNKIKGCNILDELYGNIAIIAKKKSGKTSTIFKILKSCSSKYSNVIIFCSTIYKDKNWGKIVKYLQDHNIPVFTYTSMFENGVNQVEELTQQLEMENKPKDKKEKEEIKTKFIQCDSDNESDEECKPRKSKLVPEYTLIFDDLSGELHNKYLGYLMKRNRHFLMRIIISTQYYYDIAKDVRSQLDVILLFPNIPLEKLETIHKEIDVSTPFNIFYALYKNATSEKYNFLYVDIRNEKYRRNFNFQYEISQ